MRARALLIETLVGIASAAVAAGAFCWMVKYTVLKEADMIVIAAAVWLWVACKLLTWANRRNTHDQETSEDMRSKYRQRFYSARRTEQPFI